MSEINYSNRIGKLKSRYNPDRTQLFEDRVHREIAGLVGDTQKYVRMAMMAVDEEYTKKTKKAGEAVKGTLEKRIVRC